MIPDLENKEYLHARESGEILTPIKQYGRKVHCLRKDGTEKTYDVNEIIIPC